MKKQIFIIGVLIGLLTTIVSATEQGLVGYWRFNEGSGATASDSSGHGNNGTIYGAKWVDGKSGKALSFDDGNYVKIPNSESVNIRYITIVAWVNLKSWGNGGAIVCKGTGGGGEVYSLDVCDNKYRFYFWKNNQPYILDSLTAPSGWQHIVATYDGTIEKFYVNGVRTNSESQNAGTLDVNTHIVSIGSRQEQAEAYNLNVNGLIDEVRIYNRALNQEEIRALYLINSRQAALEALSHYKNGLANYSKGDYSAAVLDFNNAISLNPNYTTAKNALAIVEAKRQEEARRQEEVRKQEEAKKQEALRLAEARRQEEEKRIAKKKEIQAVLINSLILGVIISAGVFLFKWISSQKKSERSSGELKNIAAPQPAAAVTFEAALEKLFTDPKDFRSYLRIKELMDAGEYEKALNIYGLKTGRLTEADKINLFEINLRLNKQDRARLVFEDVKGSDLLQRNPELRKKLVDLCNEKGQTDLAGALCRADEAKTPAGDNIHGFDSVSPLAREGKDNEVLKALLKKPQNQLTLTDYNRLFEIYLQLGDFIRAGLILSTINKTITVKHPVERFQDRLVFKQNLRGNTSPAESLHTVYASLACLAKTKGRRDFASQLYRMAVDCILTTLPIHETPQECYDLAVSFEKEGENEFALELYQVLNESRRPYQDVTERYKKLKARVENEAAQPANPPHAHQFIPAPAAIKTGIAVAGQILGGKYELRGDLGEGAMGMVYDGWDIQGRCRVAVKRMHSYLKEYPAEYGRFRQEAQIVGRLKHPNIVGLHELLEQNGEIYLVFDYVAGKTLYDVLKEKKRFQLKECKDIFNGVCDAVHYAHKNNVIHRDLKPANIMLAGPAQAMVMDFGLASELREGLTRVTHQTMSGTPAYMAPEQHAGIVKRESDIYAMGVCLYEMVTGALPFTGMDNLEQKKLKTYREASALMPWLPTGVDGIISRALDPEPSQRYADALDFWSALKNL